MITIELSTCFITKDVNACREFYPRHFAALIPKTNAVPVAGQITPKKFLT